MQKNVWNIFCPVASKTANNLPVKRPVRYPYLPLEEFHPVKPRLAVEGHSRVHT
ncbi:hypothetical protein [Shewanella sp. MTB7]|uniref:hypothetical protein n=1 Tax=Shewanella sp. MTB7 TaxID=2746932 RepID=UPI0022BA265A|nr:hypothetical protein [Shewanella sp. MTB7]WBJ94267.1 hypothetical protein HWQ47_20605 [Shewanella sp. MTB7]